MKSRVHWFFSNLWGSLKDFLVYVGIILAIILFLVLLAVNDRSDSAEIEMSRDEYQQELYYAQDDGYEQGYEAGRTDGYDEALSDYSLKDVAEQVESSYHSGYSRGFSDGKEGGFESGYDNGYDIGYDTGYESGKQFRTDEAYNAGYRDGVLSQPSGTVFIPLWLFISLCILPVIFFILFLVEHRRCVIARKEEDNAKIELIRLKKSRDVSR